ncbi:hypothetical protein Ab1vBOLIVR2_gp04 [Agrobacterium phage OLIVR2]|uniref:Uncharacterized protein n=1 Tax=Agrobacterium phage OLIVR1 TaxID=2723769 RepID=A0A858MRH3_9CAUD|nr:hypothetical protein [Xanthomonas campestris]YP_010107038.1 hypothetical protein KNU98_gp105 [Agrobacterium phage OLIVR1]QIW87307.1 hypothetical protein Ab1vBOLIVR2_gp04 [Agrobacterium phage OLIVR2]QIW87414.1 hypothetical protein Ab1vBOLIVR3_gp04 [Agrobacterium phage OLIVR3]MCF8861610.1 hypothetical protein [Xanthomonas campestris pv. campestris]QIW87199.1 hypothetical protein Ab1vBOLIVR1_gp04 [Agrobacterium phage OLIVR1]
MSEVIMKGNLRYTITFNIDPNTERKHPVCTFVDGQPLGLHRNRGEAEQAINKDFFSRSLTEGARYRHVKRGGVYTVIATAKLQADNWITNTLEPATVDMTEMVVYRSEDDQSVWVHSKSEFIDGRFEIIDDTPVQ